MAKANMEYDDNDPSNGGVAPIKSSAPTPTMGPQSNSVGGSLASSSPGGSNGGSKGPPGGQVGGPQQQGTGFTNLQDMLNANSQAAGRMDNALAAQGNAQTAQFTNDLAAAQKQYGQDTQAGAVGTNDGQGYTGPMSLGTDPNANYGKLAGEAQSASSYNKNLGSQPGIQANLQGIYGGQGNGMMDAFLAGNGPGASQLSGMAKNFGNLGQTLANADQASVAQAQAAATPKQYGPPPPGTPQLGGGPAPKNPGSTPGNAKNWKGDNRNDYTYGAY